MHPQEEALRRLRAQPRDGPAGRFNALALIQQLPVRTTRQFVVVDVEPARQSEPAIERKRRDKRGCRKPRGLEHRGQRWNRVRHRDAVMAGAVAGWITSAQQARVGREGNRRRGQRPGETHTLPGHLVHRRRVSRSVSVGAKPIRA